jgi:hypothetical protein
MDDCSICLDGCICFPELIFTKCGHVYHIGCLKTWLNKQNICPNCKTPEPWIDFIPQKKNICACCGRDPVPVSPVSPDRLMIDLNRVMTHALSRPLSPSSFRLMAFALTEGLSFN